MKLQINAGFDSAFSWHVGVKQKAIVLDDAKSAMASSPLEASLTSNPSAKRLACKSRLRDGLSATMRIREALTRRRAMQVVAIS
jgi:hypothetical protein